MTNDAIRETVLAAFRTAEEQGQPLRDCYLAAVDAYAQFFPDYTREPIARRAVNIILATKEDELMRVE